MIDESNNSESQSNWPEPRVEKLLGWFFAQEMPPALRDAAAPVSNLSRPVVLTSATSNRVAATSAGRWLLPLCVAALVGSAWLLQQSTPRGTNLIAARQTSPDIELETTSLPWAVEQISYAGSHGQLEQRSELRWTSRSYYDPAAGVWVEWSAPELVIDVEAAGSDRTEQRL